MWREGEGKRESGRKRRFSERSASHLRGPASKIAKWAPARPLAPRLGHQTWTTKTWPPDLGHARAKRSGMRGDRCALEGELRQVDHRRPIIAALEQHAPLRGGRAHNGKTGQ